MKEQIGKRIRKIRESKDLSQENVASELEISTSAYAKIERGATDPSANRLVQIAKVLEVDVTDFFQDMKPVSKVGEQSKNYGFATKGDIEELFQIIKQMQADMQKMQSEMNMKKVVAKKKK